MQPAMLRTWFGWLTLPPTYKIAIVTAPKSLLLGVCYWIEHGADIEPRNRDRTDEGIGVA